MLQRSSKIFVGHRFVYTLFFHVLVVLLDHHKLGINKNMTELHWEPNAGLRFWEDGRCVHILGGHKGAVTLLQPGKVVFFVAYHHCIGLVKQGMFVSFCT